MLKLNYSKRNVRLDFNRTMEYHGLKLFRQSNARSANSHLNRFSPATLSQDPVAALHFPAHPNHLHPHSQGRCTSHGADSSSRSFFNALWWICQLRISNNIHFENSRIEIVFDFLKKTFFRRTDSTIMSASKISSTTCHIIRLWSPSSHIRLNDEAIHHLGVLQKLRTIVY